MKIEQFLRSLDVAFTDIARGEVSAEGSQIVFDVQELNFHCRRLSTAQIGVVIALGASSLCQDEAYLNIGVWEGFSLLAASIGSPGSTIIGVDNFSEMHLLLQPRLYPDLSRAYGNTRDNFYRALRQCGSPRTQFFEMDWKELLIIAPFPPGGLGLVFYDGEHTPEAHQQFFKDIVSHLSDECVIILDDICTDFVRRSVSQFLASNPGFHILHELGGVRRRDPAWWGGLILLGRYSKMP